MYVCLFSIFRKNAIHFFQKKYLQNTKQKAQNTKHKTQNREKDSLNETNDQLSQRVTLLENRLSQRESQIHELRHSQTMSSELSLNANSPSSYIINKHIEKSFFVLFFLWQGVAIV